MITNAHNEYQNEYAFDNVYGHVVRLLNENLSADAENSGIHLDLGCGYSAIATHVKDMGRTFVGVDANARAISSLQSRGFEAHCATLDADSVFSRLSEIIGKRKVSSISLIDTLEHLPDGQGILAGIHRIARENNALFVVSVPNIGHRDIGFKLALGSIRYTEAGLLDHTHVKMYDEVTLRRELRYCGFHVVATNHVKQNHSDQFFPKTHPAFQEGTTLRLFLKNLRSDVDSNDIVNQLVLACLPGENLSELPFVQTRDVKRPLLTVVTRTQGNRPQSLNEFLTCMMGQTDRDFELLIVGHKLTIDRQITVEQAIEDLPEWMRSKTRLIRVDHGNRTHPLNVGFSEAKGQYIAIHDDDDLPMGHWVESFRKASVANPGRILRCVSVILPVDRIETGGFDAVRATGSFIRQFPAEFDYFVHLRMNQSPNNTIAFPRGIFEDLNLSFDEELTTTEDWDLILRAASLVDVSSLPEITGIYQWADGNSSTVHSQEEWGLNERRIIHKLNSRPLLLPAGSVVKLRSLQEERDHLRLSLDSRQTEIQYIDSSPRKDELLRQIASVFESRSWRVSSPIRWIARILGKSKPMPMSQIIGKSEDELLQILAGLHNSTSWRISAPLRKLRSA